jgi:hypothetical protein
MKHEGLAFFSTLILIVYSNSIEVRVAITKCKIYHLFLIEQKSGETPQSFQPLCHNQKCYYSNWFKSNLK